MKLLGFFLLTFFTLSRAADAGELGYIQDGEVTCVTYHMASHRGGGISCTGDISKVSIDKLGPKEMATRYQTVARQFVADKLCYTMESKSGWYAGVSCVSK